MQHNPDLLALRLSYLGQHRLDLAETAKHLAVTVKVSVISCNSCSLKSCSPYEDGCLVLSLQRVEKEESESAESTAVWTGVETESDGRDTWSAVQDVDDDGVNVIKNTCLHLMVGKGCMLRAASTPRSWKSQEQLVDVPDLVFVGVPAKKIFEEIGNIPNCFVRKELLSRCLRRWRNLRLSCSATWA